MPEFAQDPPIFADRLVIGRTRRVVKRSGCKTFRAAPYKLEGGCGGGVASLTGAAELRVLVEPPAAVAFPGKQRLSPTAHASPVEPIPQQLHHAIVSAGRVRALEFANAFPAHSLSQRARLRLGVFGDAATFQSGDGHAKAMAPRTR